MAVHSRAAKRIQPDISPEDLCFKGNEELVHHRPLQAIQYYSHVLHNICGGHIGALLNRCLAYNLLEYPELAVFDAYAAVMLAYQCRDLRAPTNGPIIRDTVNYAAAEREAVIGGSWTWLEKDRTNVGTEWMTAPLASLLLVPGFAPAPDDPRPPFNLVPTPPQTPPPDSSGGPYIPPPQPSLTPQVIRMMDMFRNLEIMAMWRLIGSLRQCGCGALADALGMVDDVHMKYKLSDFESRCFKNLGTLIWREIESNYEADPKMTDAFMKSRITMVNRVVYPWNTYESGMENFAKLGEGLAFQGAKTLDKPYALRRKPADSNRGACLRLVAARDIFPGELIVTQANPLQVTLQPPLEPGAETCSCIACAATMISSHQTRDNPHLARFRIPQEQLPESVDSMIVISSSSSDDDCRIISLGNRDRVKENRRSVLRARNSNPPGRKIQPVPYRDPPPPEDQANWPSFVPHRGFQRCGRCDEAVVCSKACAASANEYHAILCRTGTEEMIRNFYRGRLARAECEGTKLDASLQEILDSCRVNPHERHIHDLLFARILGLSAQAGVHPLLHADVRWLDGGFSPTTTPAPVSVHGSFGGMERDPPLYARYAPPSAATAASSSSQGPQQSRKKTLPWSFTHNVVLPARYMMEIGLEPFLHLESYEGWVVNTLYAKILQSARVMRGARHGKVFDEYGELYADVELGEGDVGREYWVGSLGHLVGMVGVEGDDEGSAEGGQEGGGGGVNVRVEEGSEVRLFAVGTDAGKDGAGKDGCDVVEGNPLPGVINDDSAMRMDVTMTTSSTPPIDPAILDIPSSSTLACSKPNAAPELPGDQWTSSTQSTSHHADPDRMDWTPSSPVTSTTSIGPHPSSSSSHRTSQTMMPSAPKRERVPVIRAGEVLVRARNGPAGLDGKAGSG